MKRLGIALSALALIAGGCGTGASSNERTVLVDYSHDEVATALFKNFPGRVDVTPGMTVVFKQTWTGEPHTVTGGKFVDEMMTSSKPWLDLFGAFEDLQGSGANLPDPAVADGPASGLFRAVEKAADEEAKDLFFSSYDELRRQGVPLPDRRDPGDATLSGLDKIINRYSEDSIGSLPWAFGEDDITQNAGQPCYLSRGRPPKKETEACAKSDQVQPEFDGNASYYNSGIIPYEGPQGNTYRVKLTNDIKPGSYYFYCAVHGPEQTTEVRVRPSDTEVPSQEAVNRTARAEIERFAKPMLKAFRDAQDGTIDVDGGTVNGPFAGLTVPVHGILNAMIPKTVRAKAGEKVTWKIMGADHSISFDVPRYFPIMRFAKDGRISLNPKLQAPSGGSPNFPENRQGVVKIDGGTYDGDGFFSSGLFSSEPYAQYSLRFSKPGTYKYACLLHPPMVGTVQVS